MSLRRDRRRVHFYSLTCGSGDAERYQVPIDFPERALLRPAEAAIEYESCGRKLSRYTARFPKDTEAGRALFGYVRSESRLLEKLLGESPMENSSHLSDGTVAERKPQRLGLRA